MYYRQDCHRIERRLKGNSPPDGIRSLLSCTYPIRQTARVSTPSRSKYPAVDRNLEGEKKQLWPRRDRNDVWRFWGTRRDWASLSLFCPFWRTLHSLRVPPMHGLSYIFVPAASWSLWRCPSCTGSTVMLRFKGPCTPVFMVPTFYRRSRVRVTGSLKQNGCS